MSSPVTSFSGPVTLFPSPSRQRCVKSAVDINRVNSSSTELASCRYKYPVNNYLNTELVLAESSNPKSLNFSERSVFLETVVLLKSTL